MTHKHSPLIAAVLVLAACADQSPTAGISAPTAPLHAAQTGRGVEGQYIVVLKEGADPRAVASHAGASPRLVYTAAINGFAGTLNPGQLNALRHHPLVEYVEQDQVGGIAVTQTPVTWGLDRIDQR
ncbi:MAG TPA: protease inhibitor I9 family protein, partial [Armatimonadota bacterium]|nr:protease inhibitor I9 family protein [Armatimonadota bacterium]